MKRGCFIVAGITLVLGSLAWIPISPFLAWRRDYMEAEPVLQHVWKLADVMRSFSDKKGRLPTTLKEAQEFAPDIDLSPLEKYDLAFTPRGESICYVDVNRRFAFEIHRTFTPSWAKWDGMPVSPSSSP